MWPNPQFSADLVTFTKEILNGKLHFFAVKVVLEVHFRAATKHLRLSFYKNRQQMLLASIMNVYTQSWIRLWILVDVN